jgi:probable HAF family extracellular repeat protein
VHAFVLDNGALSDLATLGGEYSIAMAINAVRQVVGISSTFVDNRAFLYAGTRIFDLFGEATGVNGINASGDIVGQVANVIPFLYAGGNVYDLNHLVANPLAGAPLTDARAINDAGQIVANSCVLSVCNAFRLDPVVDGYVPPIVSVYEFYSRTGWMFKANDRAVAGAQPVCRFYIPPQHGDSHFFAASPDECATVLGNAATDPNYSGYVKETAAAFHAPLPDASGACATGTSPVYQLWNHRADSNHRYTTDRAVREQMIAAGYVPEGYGPHGVGMCAPN